MERERRLIHAAIGATRQGDGSRYRKLLAALAGGSPAVAVELDVMMGEALAQARERNWALVDVRRQVERRLSARHAGWLAHGARLVDAGDGAGMALAIEVLALVSSLPALPRLGPAPARDRGPEDTPVLEKVRALLAKAESTTFPEEAEALSAKAQ
jgi:hypothetical protein